MAKMTFEIDTENVSSVLNLHAMLTRLIEMWRKTLPENDTKQIQQTPQENRPETTG